jgi:hypothetical protein
MRRASKRGDNRQNRFYYVPGSDRSSEIEVKLIIFMHPVCNTNKQQQQYQ